ncbi:MULTISPECIES: hypothetical protein [Vibrio]|uniref:WD40 repeat protein n=1 Tax=Vibrio proteolyticus NBRC 13287 TaxID=1219065 RepID=U2ZVY2_VIBPR|nr:MULTISPECIES: hypothetical protein [Vibrio]NAX20229.1 hypothetical protein [Vibrio sp. V39_P1S14PM300]GAD65252.1 hypothetical protein VPR01S_01_00250 [Vibrio proteolyticus NBRC 13287]
MTKWILLLLACFSLTAASGETPPKNDLTQFDLPFLLGDWYLLNPEPEQSQENFLAIKLSLRSTYSFSIDIQKKDYSVDHWEGFYTANEDTIILGVNTTEPQIYAYEGNHNLLNLNGVTFTKALSNGLAGVWSSAELSGADIQASDVQHMDLVLQPDFIFMFRATNGEGDEAIHRGVYYTEDNNLVLMYENGEHETTYSLKRDQLTLQGDDGEMFAVLDRIR